jgi:DNA-directed RNA polymerase subunit RPC12/RpoP
LNRFVFFRCTRCGEILKKPLHQKGNQCIRCSLAPDPAYDD